MSKSLSNECFRSILSGKKEYRLVINHYNGMAVSWIIDKAQAEVITGILERAENAPVGSRNYSIELGLNTGEDVVIIPAYIFWNKEGRWSIKKYE